MKKKIIDKISDKLVKAFLKNKIIKLNYIDVKLLKRSF